MSAGIRVLIADDQAISREGIQRILEDEEDMQVVGAAQTAPEVLEEVRQRKPDVVLLDLKWHRDDRAMEHVITELREGFPEVRIIALTAYAGLMKSARAAGASWALTKDVSRHELLCAIRAAYVSACASKASPRQQKRLASLRRALDERFDEGGLRTLCFDLGVDYEELPAEGKINKARELIRYMQHRERIAELLEVGRQLRPDIPWSQF